MKGPQELAGADAPTVLVCDDDVCVIEIVSVMLARRGYKVVTASCGEQALQHALRERPDVILLDLLMPGMSGWETAAALKEHAETASIPIVILSVLAEADTTAPEGQIIDWVQKPLDDAQLFSALEPGDTLTLTYGEAMKAPTLISGWSGTGSASLSVRLTDASNAETITLAPGLGTIAPGGDYAGKNKTVTFAATATLSSAGGGGSIVTIVLGTPSGTGLRTQLGAVAMKWTPSSTATDLAGNGSSTATVTESGTIDRDF